jgi:hypothetical protein
MKEIIKKTIKIGVIGILTFFFIFSPILVSAQTNTTDFTQQLAMAVDPAIIELIVDKSEIGKKEITVYNTSSLALPIKAVVQGFNPGEAVDIKEKDLETYDASSWIKIDPKDRDFILQPKASKKVSVSVTVPPEAPAGGHYATIYFNPLIPQALVSDSSVFIYARIAVLVFIQVKGTFTEKLTVDSLKTKYINQSLPVNMTFNVSNVGNSHIRPTGKIKITSEISRKFAGETAIPLQIVLPGTTREYKVDIGQSLRPGFYSAELTMNYGTTTEVNVKTDKTYFFVLPSFITYIYIGIGLLVLIIGFRFRKRLWLIARVLFTGSSKVSLEGAPKEEIKKIIREELKNQNIQTSKNEVRSETKKEVLEVKEEKEEKNINLPKWKQDLEGGVKKIKYKRVK